MKTYEVASATILFVVMGLYWVVDDLTREPVCHIETNKGDHVVIETYPQHVCDQMLGRE